jgi:hypothetical protein
MKTMGISAPAIARKNPASGKRRADHLKTDTRVCVVQPISKAKVTLPKLNLKRAEE